MPTQPKGYYTRDGQKRPSVTTILGRFKDSGALIQWAYKRGREHGDLAARGFPAPERLYDEVQLAASIGTLVHAMAEDRVHGKDAWARLKDCELDEESVKKATNGYQAFENWLGMSRLEILYTEQPMVSEALRCGGTLDWIGRLDGRLVLGDFKTSNAVYAEHLVQVAAYRDMWNETHPDEPLEPGAHILQFGKSHGDFAHHYYPDLSEASALFRIYRDAYDIDSTLRKRAARAPQED
jgi:hypothetical protein